MRFLSVILLLILGVSARAQVQVISPRAYAVLQVRGDHANLHVKVKLPQSYTSFRITIVSDSSYPHDADVPITIANGLVDTIIRIPRSLHNYTLDWTADSANVRVSGEISGLTPGHIIGIAGQSNAEGNNYSMNESAKGDIRMLRNDSAWEPAHEPTGHLAGGSWIVMANELYRFI